MNNQNKKIRYRKARKTGKPQHPQKVRLTGFQQSFKDDYAKEASPPAPTGKPIVKPSTQHVRISVRLPRGIVTSLTIKKNIIGIWLLYTCNHFLLNTEILDKEKAKEAEPLTEEEIVADKELIAKSIMDFVYKCLNDWDSDTGKGLSDFVTERMIEDFLDEYSLYLPLIDLIGE